MNRFSRNESDDGKVAVRVVFRLDDVSAASDRSVEERIFEAFLASGIPLTLGAIPCLCDGDVHVPTPQGELPLTESKGLFLSAMEKEGKFEVAQHGCSHQVRGGVEFRTEFSGRSFEEQRARIARGKSLLEQYVAVESFIPPWNSYDETTLRALDDLGFRTLSADPYGPVCPRCALQYLPASAGLGDLAAALQASRKARSAGKAIVVLMHAYDFRESGSQRAVLGVEDLRRILKGLPKDGGFAFTTLRECARAGMYSGRACLGGKWRKRIGRLLPRFLRARLSPDGVNLYARVPRR